MVSVVYILFGPSLSKESEQRNGSALIRGLQNVKNNCFINAILQSIAGSESMQAWFHTSNRYINFESNLIQQIDKLITSKFLVFSRANKLYSLCLLSTDLNSNHRGRVLNPHAILEALRKHDWSSSTDEQVSSMICYHGNENERSMFAGCLRTVQRVDTSHRQ